MSVKIITIARIADRLSSGMRIWREWKMSKEKALEVLEMLRDYVNENWDEEYRDDIDDVNMMYDYVVSALFTKKVVGEAFINGKK